MGISLEFAVNRIRSLLEQPEIKKLYYPFNNFPVVACDDASRILSYVLREKELGDWDVIFGEQKIPYETHVWLQRGEVIIDITADQLDPTIKKWIDTTANPDSPIKKFNYKGCIASKDVKQSLGGLGTARVLREIMERL
ncbi:hypothetical protein [Chitinophaga filiformis]|uniref:Uncharacterized protein n=1 Tax=Chitinophaga filiformis TaxID=104663 RepID=A0A1G7MLE7_CHIFI|nr:hypothetical protein [Chitinophaga filiformis]SDF61959.1 hypothetical protein SAMN04488121_102462 [Chitinophaga filiformis]